MFTRVLAIPRRLVAHRVASFVTPLRGLSTLADPSAAASGDDLVPVPLADIPSGWKGIKRFYDHVGVRPVDKHGNEAVIGTATGFKVLVQGRELRTNGMNDLIVRRRCGVVKCASTS
jgi:hypothetical protein